MHSVFGTGVPLLALEEVFGYSENALPTVQIFGSLHPEGLVDAITSRIALE